MLVIKKILLELCKMLQVISFFYLIKMIGGNLQK